MQRVVVTGMGIYSCIGKNIEEVRESLFAGKSGIGLDLARKPIGFRSCLTGILERPNLKGLIHRRLRVGLAEEGEYAYLSTVEALKMAGIDDEYLDLHEIGIIFGNDSSAQAVIDSIDTMREKKDTMLLGSASVFQSMNSTVTMNLSCIFRLKGINFTVSAACASGSHAVGMGYFFIKQGLQNMVVCGGAQEVNAYSMGSFDALSAFSIQEKEPNKASRPFDKDRDGLIPSGGAATLVLESYESALQRGAPIIAEVIGYGFSSNGAHISLPNINGPVRAIENALKDAGCRAADIDYINAHATSTPAGDGIEAKVIDAIFGATKPLISSTKSMTGYECWMAGASELVYSMIMMQHSFVAPNINLETPDEDSAKLNIVTERINRNIDVVLSNSFGFGGTNAAVVLKKFKE